MAFFVPFVASGFAAYGIELTLAGSTLLGGVGTLVDHLYENHQHANEYTGYIGSAHNVVGSSHRLTGSKRKAEDPISNDRKRQKIDNGASVEDSSPNSKMSDNVIPLVSDNVVINNSRRKLHGDPINHYRSLPYICDGDEGEEKIIALGSLGTTQQWTVSQVGLQNDVSTPRRWLDLDPNQGVAAGQYYTARGTTMDHELVLDYVTQIFEFTNFANVPAFCHLNMYKVKEANATDPILLGSLQFESIRAAPDAAFQLPAAADADGIYTAAGITATGESLPWAINHPDTKGFNNVFGKVKDWKFQLPAGGRLCLKIGIKMGMVGSRSELVLASGTFSLRPQGSIVSTFSCFGAPVLSLTNELPTHAHTKVGIIVTSMLKFRHTDVKVAADKRFTQFTGLAANNAITTERFLDTDLDEVSLVIEA